MKGTIGNGLDSIIAQAIEEMKAEQGASFHLEHLNLAELERRTGISRARLRRLQKTGFVPEFASWEKRNPKPQAGLGYFSA